LQFIDVCHGFLFVLQGDEVTILCRRSARLSPLRLVLSRRAADA